MEEEKIKKEKTNPTLYFKINKGNLFKEHKILLVMDERKRNALKYPPLKTLKKEKLKLRLVHRQGFYYRSGDGFCQQSAGPNYCLF